MNKITPILFGIVACTMLYLTNPSDAIKDCEKVNTVEMCEVLNAE
ncbi:hypothetical protein vBVpaMR16F_4 [Vibrio phage vB_VpaM_R16F]|nr:hypothetical protein vBVpaMR16F_4 [Vibrio phage vB_VpaM_R16F]